MSKMEPGSTLVELPWVYDGTSIVEHADGRVENVWDAEVERAPEERVYRWRQEETAKYIERNYREGRYVGQPLI